MKLIATNISNLTDARFFAAYLPEIMVLPALKHDESIADRLQWFDQIRSWIEGPEWALTCTSYPSEKDMEMMSESGIATILHSCDIADFKAVAGFRNFLISNVGDPDLKNLPSQAIDALIVTDVNIGYDDPTNRLPADPPIYLEVKSMQHWLRVKCWADRICGIVLRGGEEEKVGIKSYDQLREVCEAIMD
ncbi:MAG: hypothetical protein HKN76_16250 [Saprospiraceae bacterium]|nr:hypothetical protein [Saprospiraceae bacterium]